VSGVDTLIDVPPDDELSPGDLQRLIATYQVERADEQHTATLIHALVATGLTFIVAATAFLSGGSGAKLSPWLVSLIPIPAWILAGLVTFHVAASQLRQSYIMDLEERLSHERTGGYRRYPRFTALHQGLYKPSHEGVARNLSVVVLSRVTGSAPVAVILLFTGYVVWSVGDKVDLSDCWQIVASTAYGALAALNLRVSFWAATRHDDLHRWAEHDLEHLGSWRSSAAAPP